MTQSALAFHGTSFDIVSRNGQAWLRSPQIAEALGYNQANRITDLYNRNAAEFTDSMTAVVKLQDLPPRSADAGQMREVRIFSLRGAHLLGMFARTARAAEFRRWVLDVLDKEAKYADLPAMPATVPHVSRVLMLAGRVLEQMHSPDVRMVVYQNDKGELGCTALAADALAMGVDEWIDFVGRPNDLLLSTEQLVRIVTHAQKRLNDRTAFYEQGYKAMVRKQALGAAK